MKPFRVSAAVKTCCGDGAYLPRTPVVASRRKDRRKHQRVPVAVQEVCVGFHKGTNRIARAVLSIVGTAGLMVVLGCSGADEVEVTSEAESQPTTTIDVGSHMDDELTYHVAIIKTKFGEITIRFLEELAPKHTENFIQLANDGFYNGTTFHRVIPGFMIQGGDPLSKNQREREKHGTGGPGYTIPAEIAAPHILGAVAAARTGDQVNPQRRSSGSQFYICVAPAPFLDRQYSVFGQVIDGMEVAQKIVEVPRDPRDNPLQPVVMESVRIETRKMELP